MTKTRYGLYNPCLLFGTMSKSSKSMQVLVILSMPEGQSSTTSLLPKYTLCQEFYPEEAHKGGPCTCFQPKPTAPVTIPKYDYKYCQYIHPEMAHHKGCCTCFNN